MFSLTPIMQCSAYQIDLSCVGPNVLLLNYPVDHAFIGAILLLLALLVFLDFMPDHNKIKLSVRQQFRILSRLIGTL